MTDKSSGRGLSVQSTLESRDDATHATEEQGFADFLAGQDPVQAAAAHWLVRRLDGLDAAEQRAFEVWLAADPTHRQALQEMEQAWGRLGDIPDAGPGPHGEAAEPTAPLRQPMPSRQVSSKSETVGRRISRRAWLAATAGRLPPAGLGMLALSALGGGWLGYASWRRQPVYQAQWATRRGEQKKVSLPDGSTLWLDTATRAEVIYGHDSRTVRLSEGQVYCEVVRAHDLPFDVLAGHARASVLGTRFSVRHVVVPDVSFGSAIPSDPVVPGSPAVALDGPMDAPVEVAVDEGRVRVGPAGDVSDDGGSDDRSVVLTAGQTVVLDVWGRLGRVSTLAAGAVAAWRQGRIAFVDTPLALALAEFERYGDTRMVIEDAAVAALRIHGSYELRQVGAFARALPQVLPVRLRARADGRVLIEASR